MSLWHRSTEPKVRGSNPLRRIGIPVLDSARGMVSARDCIGLHVPAPRKGKCSATSFLASINFPSVSGTLAPFVIGGLVSIDTAADHSDENDGRIKGREHCDSAACCGTMENIVCKGAIYEGKWDMPDC